MNDIKTKVSYQISNSKHRVSFDNNFDRNSFVGIDGVYGQIRAKSLDELKLLLEDMNLFFKEAKNKIESHGG